jgi:hypothetical protein
MKRKVYATSQERKADQIKGFWAFPLVNVPLQTIVWMILWMSSYVIYPRELTLVWALPLLFVRVLPWLVNGIVLVLAFMFRPEFGVGYIAFIAVAIIASTALSILFVAACFVSILSAAVMEDLAIWVFVFLMVAGLLGLGVFAIYVFRSWQSSFKNNSH